jgi:TPR repeat protein
MIRLGECYEYGRLPTRSSTVYSLLCMSNPHALSLSPVLPVVPQHSKAIDACFALTAWYLVGSPGVLPQSDTEAFLWAKKDADAGLAKAMLCFRSWDRNHTFHA